MKAYGGVDIKIHIFLTSALAEGEWSASRPCRYTPEERALGTHWRGGWVGPRAGLEDVEKRKFLTLPGLEFRPLDRPARSQSLYRLRYIYIYIIQFRRQESMLQIYTLLLLKSMAFQFSLLSYFTLCLAFIFSFCPHHVLRESHYSEDVLSRDYSLPDKFQKACHWEDYVTGNKKYAISELLSVKPFSSFRFWKKEFTFIYLILHLFSLCVYKSVEIFRLITAATRSKA
jgi:hypothetical protein